MFRRTQQRLASSSPVDKYAALDQLVAKACPGGQRGEHFQDGANAFVPVIVY